MKATKSNSIISTKVDETAPGWVAVEVAGVGVVTVGINDLTDEIARMAALHGLKQKLCDAAAIPRDPDTGRSATPAEKFAAIQAVHQNLMAGVWNVKRGNGSGAGAGGLLFRALVRYTGKDPVTIRERLDGMTKEQQSALRKNPKIAAIIDELRAEAAGGSDVDTDSLLDDLMD